MKAIKYFLNSILGILIGSGLAESFKSGEIFFGVLFLLIFVIIILQVVVSYRESINKIEEEL